MSVRSATQVAVNAALRPLNVQMIRGHTTDPAVQTFISARQTITAARAAGMSVSDYVDQTFAVPGATAGTVDAMIGLSGLSSARRVCEIGPGTGRYSEKVIAALEPEAYEIYETAADWLRHLAHLPGVVVQPCDGHTLAPTTSESIDLVHAHKLFVYIPFEATMGYLDEMVRVVRPGGSIAFDVVTEQCLSDDVLKLWIAKGTIFRPLPRAWLLDHLAARGMSFSGSHIAPMTDGRTELLVFRKADG